MPIFEPSQRPEPKSAWTPTSVPIDAITCAEFAATGSVSTRWFHAFVAGKSGQPPIVGDGAVAPASRATKARAATFTCGGVAAREDARVTPKGVRHFQKCLTPLDLGSWSRARTAV